MVGGAALSADPGSQPTTCAEFARRVAEAALAGASEPDEKERRAEMRYPSRLEANCQAVGGEKEWVGKFVDISRMGACLLLGRRFEPSSMLRVGVMSGQEAEAGTLLARVQWVRMVAPRLWNVGCKFGQPLTECELTSLLGNKTLTVVVSRP